MVTSKPLSSKPWLSDQSYYTHGLAPKVCKRDGNRARVGYVRFRFDVEV